MEASHKSKVWLVLAIVLLILISFFGFTYNKLVKSQEAVTKNWSDLQSAYQRRIDLIPSLVSVVKGSSNFEQKTLVDLMEVRARAQQTTLAANATDIQSYKSQEISQAEVVQTFNKVIAIAEKYPDLKTTKSYLYLQTQLEGTERRIKVSRFDFNSSVAEYNKLVRQFPSNVTAGLFGFKAKEGFSSDISSQNPPEVKF
jgi:LemA protein